MSNHTNPEIQKHINNSEQLVQKMQHLAQILTEENNTNFKNLTGVELPSALDARVRKVDISMVYATDPKVDEYIMGAKNILDAAFKGNEFEVIDKSLNLVGNIANGIIGSGTIQTGIHSDSALIGEYIAGCTRPLAKVVAGVLWSLNKSERYPSIINFAYYFAERAEVRNCIAQLSDSTLKPIFFGDFSNPQLIF